LRGVLVGADCIRPTARLQLSIERDCHRVEGRMQSAPTDCGYIHQRKSALQGDLATRERLGSPTRYQISETRQGASHQFRLFPEIRIHGGFVGAGLC
jgi:hypothetical protein